MTEVFSQPARQRLSIKSQLICDKIIGKFEDITQELPEAPFD
jgi:hypothetical protein